MRSLPPALRRLPRLPRLPLVALVALGACMVVSVRAEDSAHVSVRPGSTVLPAYTREVAMTVNTSAPAHCRYALSAGTPFASMLPFAQQLAPDRAAANISISPDPKITTNIFVACDAWLADPQLALAFRTLPDTSQAPFPRRGNIWGSWNFAARGLEYAASHVDLWLGAGWDPADLATLRSLNPFTLALTSINAVEGADGLPESYYLHNISGPTSRCEVWPGAYRLDLTRPEVSLYKAQQMFALVMGLPTNAASRDFQPEAAGVRDDPIVPPLAFDGIFVDNVFLTQSWLTQDIHGNPFYPDTTGTGKPDDPKVFDAEWRAGVLLELNLFRAMMPSALMSGHAMSWQDPDIAAVFNGISIGFSVPEIIEGLARFDDVLETYNGWLTAPTHMPHITMFESAVFLQVGYGYGFNDQIEAGSIPGPTMDFVRDFYSYMRLGLGLTLLQDGYFCHELGDSDHGQDWWYDELAVDLGLPLGPAEPARILSTPFSRYSPSLRLDPTVWQLFVVQGNAAATLVWDTIDARSAAGSARVNVTRASTSSGDVELHGGGFSLVANQSYMLAFWAKASSSREIDVAALKNSPNWENLGLQQAVLVGTAWTQFSVAFEATETQDDGGAKFSFFLALNIGEVWIDNVTLSIQPPPVYIRAFEHGLVVVNGDTAAHNVTVPGGYRRFSGAQAPRYQYIVDDGDSARFSANASTWSFETFAGGYNFSQPTNEVIPGPYFHHWRLGCRQARSFTDDVLSKSDTHTDAGASAGAGAGAGAGDGAGADSGSLSAVFDLGIIEADTYNLSVWWPAAPEAGSTWSQSTLFTVVDGDGITIAANRTLDQSKGGDMWNGLAVVPLRPGASVRVLCADRTGRLCVADAILVESQLRYNDGTPLSPTSALVLNAMDAVVLVLSDEEVRGREQ